MNGHTDLEEDGGVPLDGGDGALGDSAADGAEAASDPSRIIEVPLLSEELLEIVSNLKRSVPAQRQVVKALARRIWTSFGTTRQFKKLPSFSRTSKRQLRFGSRS